jgi:hypothetical protein
VHEQEDEILIKYILNLLLLVDLHSSLCFLLRLILPFVILIDLTFIYRQIRGYNCTMCLRNKSYNYRMYKNYTKRAKIQSDAESFPYGHDFYKFMSYQTYSLVGTHVA